MPTNIGHAIGSGRDFVSMELRGDKELQRLLKELAPIVGLKVVRGATTQAMTHASREIRKRIPVGKDPIQSGFLDDSPHGTLKKSLRKITKNYNNKTTFSTIVGIGRSTYGLKFATNNPARKSGFKIPASVAHLVEFGHKIKRSKSGPVLGYVEPHPFMRPGWKAARPKIKSTFKELTKKGIINKAMKLRDKHKTMAAAKAKS